jgi:two-component system, OmpR family, sensor histidine kinase TctE
MSRRIKSLQLRLTIELVALFFVASCLAVGGLIYSASLTAGSLADRELGLRAEDLARYVSLDKNRKRLELPPPLKQAYSAAAQQSLFAIRDKDGHLVEASTPEIGAMIARWPQADTEPSYFRLSKFGPLERDYSGVSIQLDSAVGPLSVLVAEVSGGNQLVHSILREFVFDIAWYVPPFVALALLLAAFSVRRSLLPLRTASAQASAIGPGSIALRLPEADVPTEALPLVIAVNHALDRLEQGFVIQRRFTANAAHELRTPLTIITARLDTLEGNGQLSALREEVARMNRLVEQLLCVARLDSLALDVSSSVDLHQLAKEVVGSMARLALSARRTIALTGADHPVVVTGNAAAIADALRNLIENALAHTAPGTEVVVEVGPAGTISVGDSGPGIPAEDRPHIFERFWRGKGVRASGAGLGLAIVMEIVRAHGASITVNDCVPHGTRFDLRFRTACRDTDSVSRPASPTSQKANSEAAECRFSAASSHPLLAVPLQDANTLSMLVRDPARMSNTWSTGWIKFRSWVTRIKVLPRSRHALASSLAILPAFSLSRLPTGSSARMSAGSLTRARAIATRCRSPPLNRWAATRDSSPSLD